MVSTLEYRVLYAPVGSSANPQVTKDGTMGVAKGWISWGYSVQLWLGRYFTTR